MTNVTLDNRRGIRHKTRMLKVLIADDQWQYARALQAELEEEPDLEIIASVHTAEDAVASAVALHDLDVVLLDLMIPEMGGVEACRRIVQQRPDLAVVIVTGHADERHWRAAMAAGARAYVVKQGPDDPARVVERLRLAAQGNTIIDNEMRAFLQGMARSVADPAEEAGLTPREREILPLLAEGHPDKVIAQRLVLTVQTVRNHVSHILGKLDMPNRTAAVAEARRRGILP
jgi:DNA-binding NarL/FixJ family response regulator